MPKYRLPFIFTVYLLPADAITIMNSTDRATRSHPIERAMAMRLRDRIRGIVKSATAPQKLSEQSVPPSSKTLAPPLKWAGGKRWQLKYLRKFWKPHSQRRLVEPFCGGL
ncbi:MAG TPA: hypothetical protein VIW64_14925, partial [Pyrinomonadaceae bacterium]